MINAAIKQKDIDVARPRGDEAMVLETDRPKVFVDGAENGLQPLPPLRPGGAETGQALVEDPRVPVGIRRPVGTKRTTCERARASPHASGQKTRGPGARLGLSVRHAL